MHRRKFLSASGPLALFVLAGCLFGGGDEPGRIDIHNDHSQDHTVRVTVEKTSDDDDDARGRTTYEILTPTTTPIWRREHTFEAPANNDVMEAEFFTEGGAFFVEVELDSGVTSATWIRLYENRGGVAETKLVIHINEDGGLIASEATAE